MEKLDQTAQTKQIEEKSKLRIDSLKKNFQFKKVYRQGRSISSGVAILFYKKNGSKQINLGISISKKIGNSVMRHRLKRIYKEAFRQVAKSITYGYDFIIVARKETARLTYQGAVDELSKMLVRGKIIR